MKAPLVILTCFITFIAVQDQWMTETYAATAYYYTESSTPTPSNPACGNSDYYGAYGVIRSPYYPGFYPEDITCEYNIYAPTGSSLSLIFKSFHVENPDSVTISCPSNPNFSTREYSGHSLPDALSIPVCAQARVSFRSDYAEVATGFSIDYYVSDAGCGGTLFIGSNGFVSSPNYPSSYRSNQNCSNIIWAPQASTINLNLRFFNLEDDCNKDWLEVSCLDNSEYGPNRLCGSQGDYDLYIDQCSQVLLWFHSDATGNYQGFFIEYTIYSSTAAACGNTSFHDKTGIISSQNYPDSYANFLYCDYTIYAPAGSPILLIFESFNTQPTNDLVTITCPGNSNIPKREYSGTDLPTPISIPDCSQALINFRTDASVVSSGFSLKYYVSDAGCGNTVHLPSYGEVTSPNYPNNYEYNQDCANIIYGFGRSSFYFGFNSFILQSCCSCDWLEISCVDNSEYGPTRYCGSYNLTYGIDIHNCSQVLLWFHSDDSGNDQGFSMWYNVYTTAAGDRKEPRNRKSLASENVPIKGKPLASENVPIKGKPLASENVPIKGKTLASENVPIKEKLNAEESRKGR